MNVRTLPMRLAVCHARRKRIFQATEKMRKEKVSKVDTQALIIKLLEKQPMTVIQIGEAMGLSRDNAAHRYLPIEGVGVVDWEYKGGRRMVAIYGISDESMTREQWFLMNGLPVNKRERNRVRMKGRDLIDDPLDRSKPAPTPASEHQSQIIIKKSFFIPERVLKRFVEDKHLGTVVFEGNKYTKDMISDQQMTKAFAMFGAQVMDKPKLTTEKKAEQLASIRQAQQDRLNAEIIEVLEDLPLVFTAKTIDEMVADTYWPNGTSLIDGARRRNLIQPTGIKHINSIEYVNPYHENYPAWLEAQEAKKPKNKRVAQEVRV